MPRESRRRRDERRFGTPRLLADSIRSTPIGSWKIAPWIEGEAIMNAEPLMDEIRSKLGSARIIDACNVSDYFYKHPRSEWGPDDFPNCAPSFPLFWVEMRRPNLVRIGPRIEREPAWCPARFGVLCEAVPVSGESDEEMDFVGGRFLPVNRIGARWLLRCDLVVSWDGKTPAFTGTVDWTFVDAVGAMLERDGLCLSGDRSEEMLGRVREVTGCFFLPFYLCLSFLNCRNVTLQAVEPDRRINRERRKAGRRPFVRYHTVNIEPIKAVLRTEGGISQHGLRRALHIVRGHFMSYTEDRPLFGRPGLHGTFWSPAHVRGSATEGVVVADYAVNPPKEPTP